MNLKKANTLEYLSLTFHSALTDNELILSRETLNGGRFDSPTKGLCQQRP